MSIRKFLRLCALLAATACFSPIPAVHAAPEEIQVYMDEFSETGKIGLDLHTNYVSRVFADHPAGGEVSTRHQFQLTPEISYGIDEHWDTALYWLTARDHGGRPYTNGAKIRVRWRPAAPSENGDWYTAVNVEMGRLSLRATPDRTSSEVKLIAMKKTGAWTVGFNFNFDRPLQQHASEGTSMDIDAKLSYRLREGLQWGIEHYASLGELRNRNGPSQASRITYLVSDFELGKWDFNVGIGRGSGNTNERTVLKAIIGLPF
ncbi:MAG: hypothetical protein HY255_01005 [Betaproteobacteria bacterium]|nr:hypothetical protein [Betaproteobacteria bacterium]